MNKMDLYLNGSKHMTYDLTPEASVGQLKELLQNWLVDAGYSTYSIKFVFNNNQEMPAVVFSTNTYDKATFSKYANLLNGGRILITATKATSPVRTSPLKAPVRAASPVRTSPLKAPGRTSPLRTSPLKAPARAASPVRTPGTPLRTSPLKSPGTPASPKAKDGLASLTLVVLKQMLKEKGLPVSGNKAALVARLEAAAAGQSPAPRKAAARSPKASPKGSPVGSRAASESGLLSSSRMGSSSSSVSGSFSGSEDSVEESRPSVSNLTSEGTEGTVFVLIFESDAIYAATTRKKVIKFWVDKYLSESTESIEDLLESVGEDGPDFSDEEELDELQIALETREYGISVCPFSS